MGTLEHEQTFMRTHEAEWVPALCPHISSEDPGETNLYKPSCGVLSHLLLPPISVQVAVSLVELQGAPCENTDAQARTEKGRKELEEGHPESPRWATMLLCCGRSTPLSLLQGVGLLFWPSPGRATPCTQVPAQTAGLTSSHGLDTGHT